MKWIGQQIYDEIARFRNKVYFEKDVEFNTDTITFTSANADDPILTLQNTTDDDQAAQFYFVKNRGAAGQDDDNVAEFKFYGYNDAATPEQIMFGAISCEIDDATDGEESGKISINVASHNGGSRRAFLGQGGSVSNEVDVTLGNGAASVTTIAGTLTMGSTATLDNSGILQTAAQTNITSLGTLTALDVDSINLNGSTITLTGDTNDTLTIDTTEHGATTLTTVDTAAEAAHFEVAADGDITLDANGQIKLEPVAGNNILLDGTVAVDAGVITGVTSLGGYNIGQRGYFEFSGYATADGSNYMYSDIMSGTRAPFLHDETTIGAAGTTADNPAAFLRANGTVMPYNGALKMWKGWGASAGSATIDVSIFKYTPTADDATNDSLVLVKNTQFTAAGNDNLKTWSETSFSVTVAAGDILISAIKGGTNNKAAYFVSTLEIEWTS